MSCSAAFKLSDSEEGVSVRNEEMSHQVISHFLSLEMLHQEAHLEKLINASNSAAVGKANLKTRGILFPLFVFNTVGIHFFLIEMSL